jgi:hypothetical protein
MKSVSLIRWVLFFEKGRDMKRKICKCGCRPKLRKYRDDLLVVCYSLKCDCGKSIYRDGIDNEEVKRWINNMWNKYEADK